MTIDFDKMQTRLVIEELVTQVILPADTEDVMVGDVVPISFDGLLFKDFLVEILDVTRTSIERLNNVDAFKCGFSFKPFFLDYLREKGLDDTVLKVDFRIVED